MKRIDFKPGFRITGGRGFHVTFKNGWTVSVQFGPFNYCEHYDLASGAATLNMFQKARDSGENWESGDAEIAVFDAKGEWRTREAVKAADVCVDLEDDVLGRVVPSDVLAVMRWVEAQP